MQLTQCRNRTVREAAIRFDAWTTRRRTELCAAGHLLSFVVLFGGVSHATYHCKLARFAQTSCGETCLAMPSFFLLAGCLRRRGCPFHAGIRGHPSCAWARSANLGGKHGPDGDERRPR